MPTRREVLGQTIAASLALGLSGGRAAAQDRYDQAALLQFYPLGDITLLHYSDLHGMMHPHFMRPAAVRYGPDRVPNLVGEALRIRYGIGGRTPMDAAMTAEGFDALGDVYGPMGGLAHMAAVLRAVRAARPGALVLDGGGTDSALAGEVLAPDAATFGARGAVPSEGIALNVEGQPAEATFDRGGTQVAVIGLADPHRPGAGVSLDRVQRAVADRRAAGAAVVVLLSRMGFEADRALASGIEGVDVILSGHSGYALPEPEVIGGTRIVASGAQGRFISRVDIAVEKGRMSELRHRLIPVFSALIRPDASAAQRLPAAETAQVGVAAAMLHHRDTFSGTWEALIGEAMLAETGAQVALVPPLRVAETVLPGQPILSRQLAGVAEGRHLAAHRLTGVAIALLLEAAAEAAFAQDPFARQETRMMRAAGLTYTIAPDADEGARISGLSLVTDGTPLEPDTDVAVALLQDGGGTPLSEALHRIVARRGQVAVTPAAVTVR
ncbi:bifunctional 2',3'-cyclic nucleotide 2'-phosphodiesterase/3'-nucleotidase precursor protein [Sulfitobacter sp. THAF37]|uniref:5'-nucleotidase C-terminal domain-containing protein n=1 Tax=Sulfitobacter sp. THAF37 TaxID=2587855 RepID=UPI0012693A3B|nr:5'-nucleotidase C-terminal domain-containing protein [Sulfitobacter sp. THAF37]QFT59600.1 bifunctional 2',3'-cyclic nucleotide 2'-phosphodiesterase/3'-nucleotidase precursor protein [Sulfitobacter sp. THAF37]